MNTSNKSSLQVDGRQSTGRCPLTEVPLSSCGFPPTAAADQLQNIQLLAITSHIGQR